jgi:hypothetical protein
MAHFEPDWKGTENEKKERWYKREVKRRPVGYCGALGPVLVQ